MKLHNKTAKLGLSLKHWRVASLLLAATLVPGNMAFAAHPLITDDAGTIGTGTKQIEVNGEYAHNEDVVDGVEIEEDNRELAVTFSYGITKSVDLVFGLPYQWARIKADGVEIGDEDGIADASFELKWRFYEKNDFSLALKPGITLPTGDEDKGLGNGEMTYGLMFIGTKELKPLAFHLNLGYTANENDVGDRHDIWHASLAGEAAVIPKLKLVANIGIESNTNSSSDTSPAFALGGLIWSVSEMLDLDLGVKTGLNDEEADITGLAGMTIRF